MTTIKLRLASVLAAFALVFVSFGPTGAAPLANAQNVQVAGTDSSGRFSLELSREVEFNVFALADPYRVIIDLPEVNFNLPEGTGEAGEGLIRAFRFGLFSAGKSRIVIDVDAPVSIVEPYLLAPVGGAPARLEIGLKKTSREDFMRDYALNGRRPVQPQNNTARPSSIADLIAPRDNQGRPVIVIDPGHGGVDPGTRSKSKGRAPEKDLVLAFARTLRDQLEASGHFDVRLTRDTDTFVALRERREFARQARAELFMSVHADSVPQGGVRGATVYTLSDDASDAVAAALAAKENKSDLIAGIEPGDVSDEVTDILVELAQRETNNLSIDFANALVKSLKGKVELNRNPRRSAAFVVLKSHDVPSVLVELGFLSNGRDASSLNSAKWRTRAAEAVSGAVQRYFRTRIAKKR